MLPGKLSFWVCKVGSHDEKDGSWPKFSLQEGPTEELTSTHVLLQTQHSWPFFWNLTLFLALMHQVGQLVSLYTLAFTDFTSFLIQQTFLTHSSIQMFVHSQILLFLSSANPHILPHTYPQWYSNNDIWHEFSVYWLRTTMIGILKCIILLKIYKHFSTVDTMGIKMFWMRMRLSESKPLV